MNPYEMMVASHDVQGAFANAPHRVLTEVWDAMGLPLVDLMTGYIHTLLYAVITAAGLFPWTGTDSGLPQGGAEGPFLYLLVTLPLAFELARVYLGYTPYQLRSPLINFADNNLLITASRHRNPANAGLPTTTDQASAILQLTTTYLDAKQLLVQPRKIGWASRLLGPRPPHPERRTHTPGGHHNPPWGHTGHTASQHRTPKQAGGTPRPTTPNCQGGPPVYTGPGILHGGSAQRGHRIPGSTPPRPPRHPLPCVPTIKQGLGTIRRLAHVLPQGGHDGPLALLRG